MDTKTLCILGAARNVAGSLPAVLANIATIASWWKECKIVIYENDSVDTTSTLLHEWKDSAVHPHIEIVQETNLNERFPNRTQRMAYIRNRLLCYIPPSFDYMFMVDMDSVFSHPVEKSSFESCFSVASWDVMTAKGATTEYYDVWALRIPGILEADCWQTFNALLSRGMNRSDATREAVSKYNRFMDAQSDILLIHSGFNIGAIYKVPAIRTCCRYSGWNLDRTEGCEHVSFHRCIRSHGSRILFNPNFKL